MVKEYSTLKDVTSMTTAFTLDKPLLGKLMTSPTTTEPVMIHDTGSRYELTINYDYSRGDIQDQWIHNSLNSGKVLLDAHLPLDPQMDNGKTLPQILHVIVNGQLLTLIDCQVLSKQSIFGQYESTTVRIRPRIITVGQPFDKSGRISRLYSSIPALSSWCNLDPVIRNSSVSEDNAIQFTIKGAPDSLELDHDRGLSVSTSLSSRETGSEGSQLVFSRNVEIVSKSSEPQDWDYHIGLHKAVKKLIDLAKYEPLTFTGMSTTPGSLPFGRCQVLSHDPQIDPAFSGDNYPFFLFTLQDIGAEGIRKWFELSKNCPEGINAINYLIENSKHIALEAHYLMMSIAFEKIGYFIYNEKNNGTDEQCFAEYLQTIINDINNTDLSGDCFPLHDSEVWKTETKNVYNDIKHAGRNHKHPDADTLIKYLAEGTLVLRVWVAKRIGCNMKKLMSNISSDNEVLKYRIGTQVVNDSKRL
jgi:hypothetical protein